jgi:hypothetical protein
LVAALVEVARTTSVTVAVCCVPVTLSVPVIVMGYSPGARLDPTATETVAFPAPDTEVGLKVAVAPFGTPVAVRFTVSVKPGVLKMVMSVLTEAPG